MGPKNNFKQGLQYMEMNIMLAMRWKTMLYDYLFLSILGSLKSLVKTDLPTLKTNAAF